MHPQNKAQTTASARGKTARESAVIITGYQDKLVIEQRVPVNRKNLNGKWRTHAKIELSERETDDLVAMLPQAVLERERAKNARQRKGRACFYGDL